MKTSKVSRLSAISLTAGLFLALSLNACSNAQENTESGRESSSKEPEKPLKQSRQFSLSKDNPIIVVYPRSTEAIAAPSSFIIGAVLPGGSLILSDGKTSKPVTLNKDGYFAQVIPLSRGENNFELQYKEAASGQIFAKQLKVNREKLKPGIPSQSLLISPDNLEPKEDRALTAGDIIEFSCRATPDAAVSVELAGKKIKLSTLSSLKAQVKGGVAPTINRGMEAAYGELFQRYPQQASDLYIGLYRIEASDNFVNAQPRYLLSKDGKSTSLASAVNLSVVRQPLTAFTLHDDTIVRVAPELARLTPLPAGVRVLTDGYQKDNIRCLYRPGKHVWIKREDLQFEPLGAPIPRAVCRTLQVGKDAYGEVVSIPMSQRLPFIVEQQTKPNRLVLKIFGAQADTDWAYQAPPDEREAKLIEDISWKQPDDHTYEIDVALKANRQWGYYLNYSDNTLNLHIKYPPTLAKGDKRLSGLKVCVDPGHGGNESGALGPSGINEATINLAIALEFKKELERLGATVYMTRERDVDVSLADRVKFAVDKKVDVLVSVHGNALPDGRDPMKEHGTSTYRYHPQSIELARFIKNAMVRDLNLPDLGERYQNLALCRPTAMPAVLAEVAFVVNPDEYSNMINPDWQAKAGKSLARGLADYFAPKPVETNQN